MSGTSSKASLCLSLAVAGIIGLISYVFICSALRPSGSSSAPLGEYEIYFAIGSSLLIFLIVFYRMRRGSWGREQVDKLMEFDDSGI